MKWMEMYELGEREMTGFIRQLAATGMPLWALVHGEYNSCSNVPFLSTGNDQREP
jgi:hypothetical protein